MAPQMRNFLIIPSVIILVTLLACSTLSPELAAPTLGPPTEKTYGTADNGSHCRADTDSYRADGAGRPNLARNRRSG